MARSFVATRYRPAVLHHVDDQAVGLLDEEAPDSAAFVCQRIDDLHAAPQRLGVNVLDVRDFDQTPAEAMAGAALRPVPNLTFAIPSAW